MELDRNSVELDNDTVNRETGASLYKQHISAPNKLVEETEKRIVIFDSCPFSAQGLALLCQRHVGWSIVGVTHSFFQLKNQLVQQPVDMVLCGINHHPGEISKLLNLPHIQTGRCVLLTENSSNVLRNMFLTAGFDAVASKQLSLNALDSLLYYTMYFPRDDNQIGNNITVYSPQERAVLSALLSGESPHRIAKNMGISYRTVSRYKQSGLKRAGVTSLNEILVYQKRYSQEDKPFFN